MSRCLTQIVPGIALAAGTAPARPITGAAITHPHQNGADGINLSLLLPSLPGLDPDATHRKSPRSSSPVTDRDITRSQESKATLPKVTNLDSWLCTWSRYLLTVIHFFPQNAREVIQYQDRIITVAERYSFEGWYNYDKAFRLKLSQDPSQQWDCLDADLWSGAEEAVRQVRPWPDHFLPAHPAG